MFFLHDPKFVLVSVFSSSLKILPTIIIYDDCFHCYSIVVVILTYEGRNLKNVHHFTKLILGKKVDSVAKRKTIKIFLFLIPFLQS